MKTSQTKIKSLRAMYLSLCKLESSLFDACAATVVELDRVLMHLEQDLEEARKKS